MPPVQKKTGHYFSGTSGLVLPVPNKKAFPGEFKHASRLSYYAHLFNSIEVNSSFYKVPLAATVKRWAQSVPADFRFTFKLYKEITHNKLLAFDSGLVEKFMQVINEAGNKKGALLIQFPKSTLLNLPQLENLLQGVKNNDGKKWDISVEFRNNTWYNDETYALLKRFTATVVLHDMPSSVPPLQTPLAKHVYLRFHGVLGDYRGTYPDTFLQHQADAITAWLQQGRTVYAYFNNTMGDAVKNVAVMNGFVKKR